MNNVHSYEPTSIMSIYDRMAEKKREAEAAVDLMSVQYERNCSEEEKRNGLLILSAFYGKFEDDFNADS